MQHSATVGLAACFVQAPKVVDVRVLCVVDRCLCCELLPLNTFGMYAASSILCSGPWSGGTFQSMPGGALVVPSERPLRQDRASSWGKRGVIRRGAGDSLWLGARGDSAPASSSGDRRSGLPTPARLSKRVGGEGIDSFQSSARTEVPLRGALLESPPFVAHASVGHLVKSWRPAQAQRG